MVRPTDESDRITLVIRRRYAAPRERVFQAWTDVEQLKAWFRPGDGVQAVIAEVEPRVGGSYRVGFKDEAKGTLNIVQGVYQSFDPPKRLAFTWT